jgi:hypothetical protein
MQAETLRSGQWDNVLREDAASAESEVQCQGLCSLPSTWSTAMEHEKNPNSDKQAAKPVQKDPSALARASRLEKYAATQAGGDGIEGDVRKRHKTDAEKLGAQMPDRK